VTRFLLILVIVSTSVEAYAKYPAHLQARRQQLKAREAQKIQALRDRRQQAYRDWHERYIADTPVREQYYQALANRYSLESALASERAAYFYDRTVFASFVIYPDYWPVFPVYIGNCGW